MADTSFHLSNQFTDEQRRAVYAPCDCHVLVLAGAGCGKTTVLTSRLLYLAHHHCSAREICALTFTRKAAEEMRSRIQNTGRFPAEPDQRPLITTFHGLALRILRETTDGQENFRRVGFQKEPSLLDKTRRLRMLAEVSTAEERLVLSTDCMGLDDLCTCVQVFPQKVSRRLAPDKRRLVEEITRRLGRLKRRYHTWDFPDMLTYVLTLFSTAPTVASHYQNRIACLCVDEFQDTNPLQIEIIQFLLGKHTPLYAVGDDDQAIYGFRGADMKPVCEFGTLFPNPYIVKLQYNFRSTPPILKTANRVFRNKPAPLRKVLVSGTHQGHTRTRFPRPEKIICRDITALAGRIGHHIDTITRSEHLTPADTALLFRLNRTLEIARQTMATVNPQLQPEPQFLTVHGAKGLEFPVVFLCDLEEGIFPHYPIRSRGLRKQLIDGIVRLFRRQSRHAAHCDFDEEQRLFYVGITRARQRLYCVHVREHTVHGRRRRYNPSRFFRFV